VELKNAVAICLISLFSATLVVMIARALDSQAGSRVETQLASIVEELQAIRKQGGVSAAPAVAAKSETVEDDLVVYYFHGNTRCPTCESIESQARETLQSDFAAQLNRGQIAWKVFNYEQPAGSPLAKKFEIQMPVVVLAKMKGGEVQDWKRLDRVWGLVGDKPAFAAHVRDEIRQMLGAGKSPARLASASEAKPVSRPAPPDLPLPDPPADLPVPK
jgi:hypothetical protein